MTRYRILSLMTHFCGQCGRAIQNDSRYAFWLCIECAKERFCPIIDEDAERRRQYDEFRSTMNFYMFGEDLVYSFDIATVTGVRKKPSQNKTL